MQRRNMIKKRSRINNMDTMTKMALREMLSGELHTEESKDTSLDDMIKEYINKYKPTVYMVCKEMLEIMKDFVKNDDYYKVVAENKRNMYNAYVKTGFSEDQAMALVLNDNLQLMKSIQNAKTTTNSKNK